MILAFPGESGVAGRQLAAALTAFAACERLLLDLPRRLGLSAGVDYRRKEEQVRLDWLGLEEQPAEEFSNTLNRVEQAYLPGGAATVASSMLRWWQNPRFEASYEEVGQRRLAGPELAQMLLDCCAVASAWEECQKPSLYVRGPLALPADELPTLQRLLPPLKTRAQLEAATDVGGAAVVHCLWQPLEPAPWRLEKTVLASAGAADPVEFALYS